MEKKFVYIIIFLMLLIPSIPIFTQSAEASVYDYKITDITQTAPGTIVVSAECRFCPYCNPNNIQSPGCTPFHCGYPPSSYPAYVGCKEGYPNGRFAAVKLLGSFGSITQKLICDQSNWPLNTLWSHNFIFSDLDLQAGETLTIEADFYCSWCGHWYAEPKTFTPQIYTFVFVPVHWDGDLGSNTEGSETGFFAEVLDHRDLLIDEIAQLTQENTELLAVNENLIFPDYTYWEWWRLPPWWVTISFSETDVDQAAEYMNKYGWDYVIDFASDHDITGNRYVALTNTEMWDEPDGNVEGFSNWGPVVIAESASISDDYVVSHEFGHSWGLLDEYRGSYWLRQAITRYLYPIGSPPNSYPGDDIPGTDWSEGRAFDGQRCIMGPADFWPNGRSYCPAHTKDEGFPIGVRSYVGCAAHVNDMIDQDIGMMSPGMVSMVIQFYNNESIQPTIESITGLPIIGKPLYYSPPSNYSIQVYSEADELIYDSNISFSFNISLNHNDPTLDACVTTDMNRVHWLAPVFSETTATIELKDNIENEIIESQTIDIPRVSDAWIDYSTTDKTSYDFGDTIQVETEIDTSLSSKVVELDVTLLDPNNIAQDYESWTGTIYPTPDPKTMSLTVPVSGTSGVWEVYVALMNNEGELIDTEVIPVDINIDNIPPSITIITPYTDEAIQDGISLLAEVTDDSGVDWVTMSIRTPDGGTGTIIDPIYESLSASDIGSDIWQLPFDSTQLPDGYYLLLINASDILGNEAYETVEFSIRNWAVLEMLPSTPEHKAGRTVPVKFSLRIAEVVDPDQPFVRNEELNILIYEDGYPDDILQNSTYGDTSKDYRIDSENEHYITNFKTSKKPKTYVVEIWRMDMLIGSFEFVTVK